MANLQKQKLVQTKTLKNPYKLNKADVFLIISILAITLAFCGIFAVGMDGFDQGSQVEVRVAGVVFGVYELAENQNIKIPQYKAGTRQLNVLEIKRGKVKMMYGSCAQQYCVKHLPIEYRGQTIVCLPNQVVVRIIGGKEAKLDAISN